MAVFTDDFTGTDGDDLDGRSGTGGVWTLASGNVNGCEILSNQLRGVHNSTTGSGFTAPDTGSADHYAQGRILTGTLTSFPLCVRLVDASNYAAGLRTQGSFGSVQVYQRDAGVFTQLGGNITVTGASASTVFKIEVIGTTVTVYQDGVSIGTRTAAVHATVQTPGINQRSTAYSALLDDWESDAVGGGGATTYNDSLTESASGSDSFAGVASSAASITESAAGTDSLAVAATGAASLTESASATDSAAAAATQAATLTEGATAGESSAATVSAAAALTEAATAGDSYAVAVTSAASVTESAAADGTFSESSAPAIYDDTITETASAADVVAAIMAGSIVLAESAGASDGYAVSVVSAATFTETGTAAVTFSVDAGTSMPAPAARDALTPAVARAALTRPSARGSLTPAVARV